MQKAWGSQQAFMPGSKGECCARLQKAGIIGPGQRQSASAGPKPFCFV